MANATSPGSVTEAMSTNQTPSGYASTTPLANSTASRVLPAPPAPDHGDQAVLSHQQAQLDALGLPADERGHLGGQVVRHRVGGAGPGELPLQTGRDQLEQPLPVVEAAQPVQAQVEQGRARRQRLGLTAVDAEQSTCPPCAAAATRAARCTSGLAYSPPRGSA